MKDSPENFERLQKLLALKKHEQPPPGFYEDFTGKVMARIQSGDPSPEENWMLQLWSTLVNRPAVSAALAAAMVGLFLILFLQTGNVTVPPQPELEAQLPWLHGGAGEPLRAVGSKSNFNPIRDDPAITSPPANAANLQSNPPSLFMQYQIKAEPAGFTK